MKIDFEIQTAHGTFSDALHLPDNHGLNDLEIETIKQARYLQWKINIAEAMAAVVQEEAQIFDETSSDDSSLTITPTKE